MKVFITGIGSGVARSIVSALLREKIFVFGSTRDGREGTLQYTLGNPWPRGALSGYDVLIHCAWELGNSRAVNVPTVASIVEVARSEGVARQIFISSLSARRDAPAPYGRDKFLAEAFFNQPFDYVIRPGLVANKGGMFKRMVHLVDRLPVMPVLGGGSFPVPLVSGVDLGASVCRILSSAPSAGKPLALFYPDLITQMEFLKLIRTVRRTRIWLPRCPAFPMIAIARVAEALHLPLPFTSGSLRAAVSNTIEGDASQLGSIFPEYQGMSSVVDAIREISHSET